MSEKIEIALPDYANAPDGTLLVIHKGKWKKTTFKELSSELDAKIERLESIKNEFEVMKKSTKHFNVYAKSHFFVVYNYFMIKVLGGNVDIENEDVLELDQKVFSGEISVKDAIEMHPLLKDVFTKLYIQNQNELLEFSEV